MEPVDRKLKRQQRKTQAERMRKLAESTDSESVRQALLKGATEIEQELATERVDNQDEEATHA